MSRSYLTYRPLSGIFTTLGALGLTSCVSLSTQNYSPCQQSKALLSVLAGDRSAEDQSPPQIDDTMQRLTQRAANKIADGDLSSDQAAEWLLRRSGRHFMGRFVVWKASVDSVGQVKFPVSMVHVENLDMSMVVTRDPQAEDQLVVLSLYRVSKQALAAQAKAEGEKADLQPVRRHRSLGFPWPPD